MRDYINPTECPRCGEEIRFEKRVGANNGASCPHCGHRIYCVFCGHPQIEIKNDAWACPFIENSPMHFGFPPTFPPTTPDGATRDWWNETRFNGRFTIEEYRNAVKSFRV